MNLATETAAAKAIRLALHRVRSIPIYVPAMTNGAGFFLRLPKRPPTNTNGPALPNVKPPPISVPPPPPPFGDLSRAAQFGILGETQMAKALVGTGLQRHHLLEQRFIYKMEGDPRMKLTVAVTEAEHQKFTNAWREKIGYGDIMPLENPYQPPADSNVVAHSAFSQNEWRYIAKIFSAWLIAVAILVAIYITTQMFCPSANLAAKTTSVASLRWPFPDNMAQRS